MKRVLEYYGQDFFYCGEVVRGDEFPYIDRCYAYLRFYSREKASECVDNVMLEIECLKKYGKSGLPELLRSFLFESVNK